MDELKSCPFCPRQPEVIQRVDNGAQYVCIMSCFCKGYSATAHQYAKGDTKEEAYNNAKEKWNTRYEPPNEPLSLDELRQMDGEPVWVEPIKNSKNTTFKEWNEPSYAIKHSANPYFVSFEKWTYWIADYGKTWLAYRRKKDGVGCTNK